MRGSIKMLLASVMVLLLGLRPDIAPFIPQIVKIGAALVLFIIGIYQLWRERQWRG